ncbi:MAG: hypothetical protein V4574_14660 [Pseudomonadota bacterium]
MNHNTHPRMPERLFHFQPRWKEELVVTASGGSFVLELPMGVLSAYLPTEAEWRRRAPGWAISLWPRLKVELEAWCSQNNAAFYIDQAADVYPL